MEFLSLDRGQLARLALALVHLGLVDPESERRLREIQLPCDLGNGPPTLEHQPDRFRLELTSERPPLPLRHEDTHIRLSQGVHEIGSIPGAWFDLTKCHPANHGVATNDDSP